MSVLRDIAATYGGPHKVVARHMSDGVREDRALLYILLAGILLFVARAPSEARLAHFDPEGVPLMARLYWDALAFIFIVPLMLYIVAGVVGVVLRLFGWKGGFFGSRLALFWALLAASPLVLLNGLVAGFIGPGTQQQIVAGLWLVVFVWFWTSGLRQAGRVEA